MTKELCRRLQFLYLGVLASLLNFLTQQGSSHCSNRGSLLFFYKQTFFMTKKQKRDIRQFKDLPNHDFLTTNQSWVLPQLASIFSEFPLVRDEMGKISPSRTLQSWREYTFLVGEYHQGVQWIKGVLSWVTQSPRGKVLGSQKQGGYRYHAGVPIVASWFLENRGVPYSSWDLTDSRSGVLWGDLACWGDPQVIEGVQACLSLGSDYLISLRENALEIKTGLKAGTMRDPKTCTAVYGAAKPFKDLPRLVQLCLCQLWVWHPHQATPYTLGIPGDPDHQGSPLISEEVLVTTKPEEKEKDWWE